MREKMIEALKAHALGHIEKHKVNVEVILQKAVGIGEHGDILTEAEKELKVIAEYDDQIEMLNKYFSDTFETPINFSEPLVDGGLNDRLYTVNVLDDQAKIMGTGVGKSKKKAEQYACKDTLINLKIIE